MVKWHCLVDAGSSSGTIKPLACSHIICQCGKLVRDKAMINSAFRTVSFCLIYLVKPETIVRTDLLRAAISSPGTKPLRVVEAARAAAGYSKVKLQTCPLYSSSSYIYVFGYL
jgi:hypothetical protein